MTAFDDLRELERRYEGYWLIDGLPILIWGTVWVLWGLALVVDDAQLRTWWAPLAFVGVAFVADRLIVALKHRITYPRTGWVVPHGWRWSVPSDFAWAMAATIAVNMLPDPTTGGSILPWCVLFGLGFGVSAVRQRAPHLFVVSGLVIVAGVAFTVLGREIAWAWACVTLGALVAALGAWRLSRYLRLHPAPQA